MNLKIFLLSDRGINHKGRNTEFISYHLISMHFNEEIGHSNSFKRRILFPTIDVVGIHTCMTSQYSFSLDAKNTRIFIPIKSRVTPSL